jgi:transketolase
VGGKLKIDSRTLARESRISTLKMIADSKSSHIGSAYSVIDILAVLYSYKINSNRLNDTILLSKGHAAAALYSILGNCGILPKETLSTYCQDGSLLGGHVSHFANCGVEFSTGSLGHALSFGAGKAFVRITTGDESKIYVVLSDGELNEGSTWEAALFASHHNLANLVVLIDRNNLQSLKSTEQTLRLEPLDEKWNSFGWDVSVIDGHNHNEIFNEIKSETSSIKQPKLVICNTIKGKGVSFMENNIEWHYKYPSGSEYKEALKEIELMK